MPRRFKAGVIPPPSHLARVLANLNRNPKPVMPNLQSLRVTMARKNDHFGARHFVKEDLPRSQFANPKLQIEVEKKVQTEEIDFSSTMEVKLAGGQTRTINLDGKWSTNIFEDLMDLAGGPTWENWKATHPSERRPVVPVVRHPAKEQPTDAEPEPVMRTRPERIAKKTEPIPEAEPVDTSGWKSVSAALP